MGVYSKASKEVQGGIRRFCKHLLEAEPHSEDLKRQAREAKPGKAKENTRSETTPGLTRDQHRWLHEHVAKNLWRSLPEADKQTWIQGQPTSTENAAGTGSTTAHTEESTTKARTTAAEQPHTRKRTYDYQALDEVAGRQAKRRQQTLMEELAKYKTSDDIAFVLAKTLNQLEDTFPDLRSKVLLAMSTDAPSAQCPDCPRLLAGLAAFRQFQPPNPSPAVAEIRSEVDHLIRNVFKERSRVQELGYPVGQMRWRKAAQECLSSSSKRGRPSKVNDPQLIELVQDRLQAHSQSSSRLCTTKKVDGEDRWQLVRTMTKQADSIFEDEPAIFTAMSNRTMKRIMKRHLWQYKPAWNESDWCQYCYDLDRKVIPQVEELMEEVRSRLCSKMSVYFQAFDTFASSICLSDQPGLFLRHFGHFIWAS